MKHYFNETIQLVSNHLWGNIFKINPEKASGGSPEWYDGQQISEQNEQKDGIKKCNLKTWQSFDNSVTNGSKIKTQTTFSFCL